MRRIEGKKTTTNSPVGGDGATTAGDVAVKFKKKRERKYFELSLCFYGKRKEKKRKENTHLLLLEEQQQP